MGRLRKGQLVPNNQDNRAINVRNYFETKAGRGETSVWDKMARSPVLAWQPVEFYAEAVLAAGASTARKGELNPRITLSNCAIASD